MRVPHAFSVLLVALALAGCAGQTRPMQLISGSGPVYPPEAKARGVEGIVVVRYGIASDGRVINARVDRAEPAGVFEEAALTAVRSWRYRPAVDRGEPVELENVVSTVRFRLEGGDAYDGY